MSRLEEMDRMYGFIEADEFTIKMSDYRHLRRRVEELEEENKRLDEALEVENELHYKASNDVAELDEENQRYKQALEVASSEMYYSLYSNKSDDVKRFYVENAKRKVDEALKGENE